MAVSASRSRGSAVAAFRISRRGRLLMITDTRNQPVPEPVDSWLRGEMTYDKVIHLRGLDAYDPVSGVRRSQRTEEQFLYAHDVYGRLICSLGWQQYLTEQIAQRFGPVEFVDLDPPHPYPKRFQADWKRAEQIMGIAFRPDQWQVIEAVEKHERGLIIASTGWGKSMLAAAWALAHPNSRLHIVVPSSELRESMYRGLLRYLPGVGQVAGAKRHFARVTVVSAQSLHLVEFDNIACKEAADEVLVDEVHMAMADQISERLARYQRVRMYGMTATPEGRSDNGDIKLRALIGERIFEMDYDDARALGVVVPIEVEFVSVPLCDDSPDVSSKQGVPQQRWGYWRNEHRHRCVAEKLSEFAADVQILCLVEKIEHALYLRRTFREVLGQEWTLAYGKLKPEDHAYYVQHGLLDEQDPLMDAKILARRKQDFREGKIIRAIATDVWSTGVDFPALAVVCRLDGRTNRIRSAQGPGRVTRRSDATGKDVGIVIDCWDEFDSRLLNRSRLRAREYRKLGWSVETPTHGNQRSLFR